MTDDERKMGKQMLGKLMMKMLQHSPINVPQPLPLIEEKAKQRLTTNGLISWKLLLKEWEKISTDDKKTIAKLLMLNSLDLMETFDIEKELLEEHKATVDYVNQHPEWGKSKEEIQAAMLTDSFDDFFSD
jgi:hypothetical protein